MHRYLPALMQRSGWKTVSVPVNHRVRGSGVSKYNNLNRALVGIADLRGKTDAQVIEALLNISDSRFQNQLIEQAHSRGIRVIGATLTPFEGALPGTPLADYHHPDKDALRRQVNEWIRHGGAFDAVIDFDAVLRDPARPARIASRFDSGDHLHPGDEGNRAMAEAVDLRALMPGLKLRDRP